MTLLMSEDSKIQGLFNRYVLALCFVLVHNEYLLKHLTNCCESDMNIMPFVTTPQSHL